MPQLIYFFPLAGSADLTVEIYPEGGGAIVNTGGDAFTDSAAPAGRYAATVAEALSGKKHVRILFDGTAIEDFLINFVGAGPHVLNPNSVNLTESLIYVPTTIVQDPRQYGRRLQFYTNEAGFTASHRLLNADGTAYNATGQTIELHFTWADGTSSKVSTTVSDTNLISYTVPTMPSESSDAHQWAARRVDSGMNKVIDAGPLHVLQAAYSES